MITKQKIKHLEKSVGNLRWEKIFVCTKKNYNQEIYRYDRKTYYNRDSIIKDIDFHKNDILVTIIWMVDDNY